MPVARRNQTGRRTWTTGQKVHVQYGLDVMAHGWGIGIPSDPAMIPSEVLIEMRACWRDCKAEIMAGHASERPGERPWGQRVFEEAA